MNDKVRRLPSRGRIRFDIRKDSVALADAAAAEAKEVLGAAIEATGAATFVATGGSTPGPIYDRLSQADLPWDKVTITLSDERWVDPASPDSNARMVRERLLQGPAAAARFLPLKGDAATPEEDANAAAGWLAALPRPIDLVFLGMGDDGHIASLFPHSPALAQGLDDETAALCIAVPCGGDRAPPQPRLTLTLPLLKSARHIVLLFAGRRKFDVLEAALAADDPYLYPVRALFGAPAGVHVLCAS